MNNIENMGDFLESLPKPEQLTIDEVKSLKYALAKDIHRLVSNFETSTGAQVVDISVQHISFTPVLTPEKEKHILDRVKVEIKV